MSKKVVIIGGGFAGLSCAQTLSNNPGFEVTLIDKQNHHLFQPLLYQVASASLAAQDISRSLRGILSTARNVSVFLDHIQEIQPHERSVKGKERCYEYDYLVIATGTRSSWFGNDEWEKHTYGLKSLWDAYQIRYSILSSLEKAEIINDPVKQQKLMTVVIVGGGPTGVEIAGAFEDLVGIALRSDFRRIDPQNLRTILIQSGDRILKAFPEEHSEYAKRRLESLGVEVMLNNRVTDVKNGEVTLQSGETIQAKTVIWAAGVRASRVSDSLKIKKDSAERPIVNTDLSLPNYRDIFAIGDIANVVDKKGVSVPGLAPAAMQMGKHVGKLLIEEKRLEKTRFAETKVDLRARFQYFDKGMMAIVGRHIAVVSMKSIGLKGTIAWLTWIFVHVMFLVGYRNKLSVLLQWGCAYASGKTGSRVFSYQENKIKEPST